MNYMVTWQSVSNFGAIKNTVTKFPKPLWSRVVFQNGADVDDYREALRVLAPVTPLIGLPIDSTYMARIREPMDAQRRVEEFFHAFYDVVRVWEVANEYNGAWTPRDNLFRCLRAAEFVKKNGGKTLWTLHGASGIAHGIPAKDRALVDYIGISYYEQDVRWEKFDWLAAFTYLAHEFPNAKLIISECGVSKRSKKSAFLEYYYEELFNVLRTRFVNFEGFGGWWYGNTDFVPSSKEFFQTLVSIAKRS